jgi:hypothetical protein
MNRLLRLSLMLLLAAACDDQMTDDDGSAPDASNADASTPQDAGAIDASAEDASATDASTDSCPLSADARALVENIVRHYIDSAGAVAAHARPREAAYVMPLIATGETFHNFAFLIAECTEPTTYVPYCLSGGVPGEGFYLAHDLCTQLSCESAGIYIYDLWMTMQPRMAPDPHLFTYETTVPPGNGAAAPNPRLTWRAVTSTDAAVDVTADLDFALEVQPANGDLLLADFTGTISSSRRTAGDDNIIEVTMDLTFPRIASTGTITVHGEVRDNDIISGEIQQGDVELGSLMRQTLPDMGLLFVEWSGTCDQ